MTSGLFGKIQRVNYYLDKLSIAAVSHLTAQASIPKSVDGKSEFHVPLRCSDHPILACSLEQTVNSSHKRQ